MKILARLQEMAESELLEMIPTSTYIRLKAIDDKPLFRAYIVGHEGKSEGYLVGVGNAIKTWFRSAIQKLHEKLQLGLKIFNQHNEDSSHVGRETIGELVGKALKIIDDKLTTIAAIYIKPEYRSLPLDVASIEADVDLERMGEADYSTDVHEVTGIALGNSKMNKPGFANATLLAQLQAFSKNNSIKIGGQFMSFSIEEIRSFLRESKSKPSDIFTNDDLINDPFVKGAMSDEVKEAVGGKHAQLNRNGEAFERERIAWADKEKALLAELGKLKTAAARSNLPVWFEKAKTERKFTEPQIKFVQTRLDKFQPSEPEKAEAEFGKYLDAEVDEYKKAAEIFGIKDETVSKDDGNLGGGPGKTILSGADKYLSPETNDFIPR